jgi:hypothetical protein
MGIGRKRRGLKFLVPAAAAGGAIATALAAGVGAAPATTAATPPAITSPPLVAGSAQVGTTLVASTGSWRGDTPMRFAFQWRRCNKAGDGCGNIKGATQGTYQIRNADAGHRLRVQVTATNSAGSSSAPSAATDIVSKPTPLPAGAIKLPTGETSIPVTSVSLPARLVIDRLTSDPNRITAHRQLFTVRFHVVDTRGFVVRDVLVYAAGVPFNRISAAPEATTGMDGWAQVQFQVLPTLDFKHTDLIAIFVRARKGGENVLAGVSARRLVSVRTA